MKKVNTFSTAQTATLKSILADSLKVRNNHIAKLETRAGIRNLIKCIRTNSFKV